MATHTAFKSAWLANLPPEAMTALHHACRPVDFDPRETIYDFGARQDRLWGVETGQVRVHVATNEHHPVLGHIITPGAWFGEVEFLLTQPAYVSMQAAEETLIHQIEIGQFRRVATRFPQLWESVARLAAMNVRLATAAANDLVLRTATQRLAATILRLSAHRGQWQNALTVETIHATQQELADLANVSRATASKVLLELQAQELLALEYGVLKLRCAAGLADVAAGNRG